MQRILDRFNMADSKGVWIPLVAHFKLSSAQCLIDIEKGQIFAVPYDKAIGSLRF